MFAVNETIEGLLRLFVLMLPVLAVILLFLAAHLVGGALKPRRRNTEQADRFASSQHERRHADDHLTTEESNPTTTHAA